jgi:hypothetical protein
MTAFCDFQRVADRGTGMKFRTMIAAAGAALTLGALAAGPASAAAIPDGGVTIEDMARFLQSKGYKAEIKGTGADRYIASGAGGLNFVVYFYDCRSSRCASIRFEADFDLTDGLSMAKINEWNTNKRYLKGNLDAHNDPIATYDVNTSPSRTYEGLTDDMGVWTDTLPTFAKFIGYN